MQNTLALKPRVPFRILMFRLFKFPGMDPGQCDQVWRNFVTQTAKLQKSLAISGRLI